MQRYDFFFNPKEFCPKKVINIFEGPNKGNTCPQYVGARKRLF